LQYPNKNRQTLINFFIFARFFGDKKKEEILTTLPHCCIFSLSPIYSQTRNESKEHVKTATKAVNLGVSNLSPRQLSLGHKSSNKHAP
jgi:hypothetical protein